MYAIKDIARLDKLFRWRRFSGVLNERANHQTSKLVESVPEFVEADLPLWALEGH